MQVGTGLVGVAGWHGDLVGVACRHGDLVGVACRHVSLWVWLVAMVVLLV